MREIAHRKIALAGACAAAVLLLAACSGGGEPPAAAAPAGEAAPAPAAASDAGAKCAVHGAPKELCFICDASLREKGRLWCGEHGRYEDRCFVCHPELREANRLYCEEHGLYEDECFLCHPELKKGAASAAEGSGARAALLCKEHGVLEEECGICHPELLAQKLPGQGLKIRMPSAASAAKAGIAVAEPGLGPMAEGVACPAELAFNQNKLAEITPLVDGVLLSVHVDLGSRVRKGDLLARVSSAAMAEAQSAYMKALAEEELQRTSFERQRQLREERITSEQELQRAEAAHKNSAATLRQARQQLAVLGLTDGQIEGVDTAATPQNLEIRAPFAGEIVARTAVQGSFAPAGKSLFTLADTSVLWVMVSIPESELHRAHVGQPVRLTVESLPGETFQGKLTWLSPQVDERTRMARGRAEVENRDGRLKAQMFARALLVTGEDARALIVPRSAVQDVAGTTVVFVKSGEDLFDARSVRLGAERDGRVEVLAGLAPHEPVVVAGSFALKSQLLISRLGAGCAD